MKFIKTWALTLCSLFFLNQAHAVAIFPINGINDLEWLELTETLGLSREDVEQQTLDPNDTFYSWRYATVEEVETLTYGLWGGITTNTDSSNFTGAETFFNAFGFARVGAFDTPSGYASNGTSYWSTLFGGTGECGDPAGGETCRGFTFITNTEHGADYNAGRLDNIGGLWTRSNTTALYDTASFLVRDAPPVTPVPIPAAAALFPFGLGLLGFVARRKSNTA